MKSQDFLVEKGNENEIIEKISLLLENKELSHRMGKRWEKIYRRYL